MEWLTTGGLVVFLVIVVGFIGYLVKLNRRAKHEQSQVDPSKLRKWSDD